MDERLVTLQAARVEPTIAARFEAPEAKMGEIHLSDIVAAVSSAAHSQRLRFNELDINFRSEADALAELSYHDVADSSRKYSGGNKQQV